MNAFVLTLLLALPNPVNLSRQQYNDEAAVLSAKPINVACVNPETTNDPTCASFVLNTRGMQQVTLLIEYTKSTATAFTLAVDGALASTGPWFTLNTTSPLTQGDYPLEDFDPTKDTSVLSAGVHRKMLVFHTYNASFMRVRIWATGGDANDKASVWAVRAGK